MGEWVRNTKILQKIHIAMMLLAPLNAVAESTLISISCFRINLFSARGGHFNKLHKLVD